MGKKGKSTEEVTKKYEKSTTKYGKCTSKVRKSKQKVSEIQYVQLMGTNTNNLYIIGRFCLSVCHEK